MPEADSLLASAARPTVMRVDQVLKRNASFPDVLSRFPDTVLGPERVLVHDDMQRAPNDRSGEQFIEAMLVNFFRHYIPYLNEHVAPMGIRFDIQKILAGQGYSDLRYGHEEDNVYAHVTLLSYSNNMGPKVDVIPLDSDIQSGRVIVEEFMSGGASVAVRRHPTVGLLPLTALDTQAAAVIESRAFPSDNQEGMAKIQNYITATSVNNEIKGRPHLSLKYVNSSGIMEGYLIAWEGVMDGKPVVFVEDIAVLPGSRLAGGRLMNGFMDLYKTHYLDTGNIIPIFVQAREETIYPILQGHVERIEEKWHVMLDVQELHTRPYGGSTMHDMRITPKPIR